MQQHDKDNDATTTTVSIQIPPNASPGDVLTFCVNGQQLEFTLPQGSCPNDVLEIQVGQGEKNEEEKSSAPGDEATRTDGVTIVPLSSNNGNDEKSLMLHTCLPSQTNVKEKDTPKDATTDDTPCDGTHAMAWPAGLELVRYFNDKNGTNVLSGCSRVLELGSGLGLVGLGLASRLQQDSHNAREIVLTDCSSALALLRHNVQQNQHLIPPNVKVITRALEWQQEETTNAREECFDLMLGSDLLYNASLIPSLVSTIQRHIDSKQGKILLAVRWRKPELERTFFELLQDTIEWTLLEGPCPLSWQEYNPTSHVYFTQTLVAVQGQPKSLLEILESDVESMTTQESQAWELAQVQIYLGQVNDSPPNKKLKN